jgi:hypothetical protein
MSKRFLLASLAALLPAPNALIAQEARLRAEPAQPAPGAFVRLVLDPDPRTGSDSVVSIRGALAGERLHFIPAGAGEWRAIGAVPVDASDSVVALVRLELASGRVDTVRGSIPVPALRPRGTPQRLAVDSRFTRPLDAATQARIARETERAMEVSRRSHDSHPLWTEPFLRPRPAAARITSAFGTGRVFNGQMTSRHLGVDFSGSVGATVRAANRGVVALVDTFFLGGIVAYIDHGGGIVTGYLHLSRTLVAAGDTVERGQEIGRVGATGRVTGPHLHWTARYGVITANPLDLTTIEEGWYVSPAAPGSSRQFW